MINFGPHSPMTYAELERMLTRFGFTKTEIVEERALLFRHGVPSAIIVLPSRLPDESVHESDLMTARFTLLQTGIAADLEEYSAAVQKAIRGNRMAIARQSNGKASGAKKKMVSVAEVAGG
jgi:hypothetical protein